MGHIEPPHFRLTRPRNPNGSLHPTQCFCERCKLFRKIKRQQRALLLQRLGKGKVTDQAIETGAAYSSPDGTVPEIILKKEVDTNSEIPFNDDVGF